MAPRRQAPAATGITRGRSRCSRPRQRRPLCDPPRRFHPSCPRLFPPQASFAVANRERCSCADSRCCGARVRAAARRPHHVGSAVVAPALQPSGHLAGLLERRLQHDDRPLRSDADLLRQAPARRDAQACGNCCAGPAPVGSRGAGAHRLHRPAPDTGGLLSPQRQRVHARTRTSGIAAVLRGHPRLEQVDAAGHAQDRSAHGRVRRCRAPGLDRGLRRGLHKPRCVRTPRLRSHDHVAASAGTEHRTHRPVGFRGAGCARASRSARPTHVRFHAAAQPRRPFCSSSASESGSTGDGTGSTGDDSPTTSRSRS